MPNDEVCLNCKILEQNTRKVPLFSKLEGNDSLLPMIIRLDKYNPKHSILKQEFPQLTKYTTNINIKSNKKERWLFYWAANKSKDPSYIMSERDAYGSNTNHGILQTDIDGNATLVLNCPQPYKDDNSKITYPRHVHYTFLTEEDTWNENINSLVVLCHIDYEMMKMINDIKSHMIISTVVNDVIDNNVYLDYQELYEMNRTERKHYLMRFLNNNIKKYSKLNAKINGKSLKLRDVPIVVFGQNREDKSSLRLSEYLIDCNIVNVIEYRGGIDDFEKNSNNVNVNDENGDENDDMEKIEYDGKTYYIHEGIDVTNDEYKLVGVWLPDEKRIKFYEPDDGSDKKDEKKDENRDENKDENKDEKKDENKDEKKGELNINDRYKEKLFVNKLDNDKERDKDVKDKDLDLDLDLDENDDIIDNRDDKQLDDLFNITDSDEEPYEDKDIRGGYNITSNDRENDLYDKKNLKEIKEIKEVKTDIPIKTEKISVLNRKYKNRGITFF